MSQQVTFTCNICGKVKGETNHWFTVWITAEQCMEINSWDSDHGPAVKDLCGEDHLLQWVSQNLKSI